MGFTFWNEWKNIDLFHNIHIFLDVPVHIYIYTLTGHLLVTPIQLLGNTIY